MPTILLVEDDEPLRKCLKLLLNKDGWQVKAVASVGEAVRKLSGEDFDLIITDYNLSTLEDGLSLLAYLKNLHLRPPAILISGNWNNRLASAAEELGAYAFLRKPFYMNEFLSVCRQAVGERCGVNVRGAPALHTRETWGRTEPTH